MRTTPTCPDVAAAIAQATGSGVPRHGSNHVNSHLLTTGLLAGMLLVSLPETGRAHGGRYVGPGDVVPPGGGSGRGSGGPTGPTTGTPPGPGSPMPSSPSGPGGSGTGGPPVPGGGGAPGGSTGGRAGALVDDLTRWDFWWEINKDPYLALRAAVHDDGPETGSDEYYLGSTRRHEGRDSLKPTEKQLVGDVLPALRRALDATDNRDITSACLVAMAKIGVDHPEFTLAAAISPRLARGDQEVRETAALALGIAATGRHRDVELLCSLARDDAAGRKVSGGSRVDDRTRAFAIHGLGLTAWQTTNLDVKAQVLAVCREVLGAPERQSIDRKVAAVHALSLLNVSGTTAGDDQVLAQALQTLDDYLAADLGPGESIAQAHVPTAVAKLLGRDHPRSAHYRAAYTAELEGKGKDKRTNHDVARSCAIALGRLVRPADAGGTDRHCHEALLSTWHDHRDKQTRYFALLALGQIGGDLHHRDVLLGEFDRGSKAQEKPWCALALGVREHHRLAAGNAEPDRLVGDTLHDALRAAKEPGLQSALAVALGLSGTRAAAATMRELLLASVAKEELAGYLCIGLCLLRDTGSIETIRAVVDKAGRRPVLLQQAAIALGKLGDKTVADQLLQLLTAETGNLAKFSALATALAAIGDRRTIAPLQQVMFDERRNPLARAFAAAALGGIGDKEMLPWNSKIGCDTNYRAAVPTLFDQATGILDIL
jgi:hypothetical protein